MYLQYLVKENKSSMLSKFFIAQWKNPAPKNEWTEQVKVDMEDFGLPLDLEKIAKKSVNSFKTELKKRAKEYAFFSFLEAKEEHSKLENLFYRDLKLQSYLFSDKVTVKEAQILFSYRTCMANYAGNYGQVKLCPLCSNHNDIQKMSFQCEKIKEKIRIQSKYSNIFSENIEPVTVKNIVDIHNTREDYLSQRMGN